jgi:hypothetical protein
MRLLDGDGFRFGVGRIPQRPAARSINATGIGCIAASD